MKLEFAIQIEKLEDDPIALRVSMGGTQKEGFYLRYRGNRDEVLRMLQTATKAFEIYGKAGPELPVQKNSPPPQKFGNS